MAGVNGSEQFANVTNETSLVPFCDGWEPPKIVKITTLSVLMIISLVGNSFVVTVFYRNKTLRTPVHYFIVNMAVSDLILPVIVLPWRIAETYHDGIWLVDGVLGSILCKLVWFVRDVSSTVSIPSMVAIAIDRFYYLLFATKTTLFTRKSCLLIIVVIWVFSVAFRAYVSFAFILVRDNTGLHCVYQWSLSLGKIEVWKISDTSWFYLSVVSAIVLTALYSSIILFLYRQKQSLLLASKLIQNRAKRNRRITCMVAIVVVVFYAVWFPFNVMITIFHFYPDYIPSCLVYWLAFSVFFTLYPAINPVVYYIFNEDYRQGFRELLCCPWLCINKCKNCIYSSVSPLIRNHASNAAQENVTENTELQLQSSL